MANSSSSTSSSVSDPCASSVTPSINKATLLGVSSTGIPGPAGPAGCPILTQTHVISNPVAGGRYYLTYTNDEMTIKNVIAVVTGTAPSATWNLKYSANYTGIGTGLFDADVTGSSTALGNRYPAEQAFATGAEVIGGDRHIWVDVSAATDAQELIINLVYTPVCENINNQFIQTFDSEGNEFQMPLISE